MSTDSAVGVSRSAGVVAGATLASRVLGLLRDSAIAYGLPVAASDAFFVAFTIPNLLRRLVGEGALTVAFVPVFGQALARSHDEARTVQRHVLPERAGYWLGAKMVEDAIAEKGIAWALRAEARELVHFTEAAARTA